MEAPGGSQRRYTVRLMDQRTRRNCEGFGNRRFRCRTHQREMRQLGVGTRLLAAVLLALVARILIFGPTLGTGLNATVIAALALASSLLTRYGQKHEPTSRRSDSSRH